MPGPQLPGELLWQEEDGIRRSLRGRQEPDLPAAPGSDGGHVVGLASLLGPTRRHDRVPCEQQPCLLTSLNFPLKTAEAPCKISRRDEVFEAAG